MWRSSIFLAYGYFPSLWASYHSKPDLVDLALPQFLKDSLGKNATNLICQKDESPSLRSTENDLYKFDQVILNSTPVAFTKGFFKSTCFPDPTEEISDDFCIFIHPTLNHGQGMVIVHRESTFEDYLLNYLDLGDDPPDPGAFKVVKMPEKGGAGAVATRRLQFGDPVARTRPVGIFPLSSRLWNIPAGHNIQRQAIDHLPLPTRAAVARLWGRGETTDKFISNVIYANMFASNVGPTHESYGAVVLEPSRLNHACRPNVVYYVDHRTQMLHMSAIQQIEAGEELTISYRSLEAFHANRKQGLKESYSFDCSCAHCRMSEDLREQSDLRIFRLQQLRARYYSAESSMRDQDVEEFLELCQKELIPWCIVTSNMIAAEFHNSRGNMAKVKQHAEVAKHFVLVLAGKHWSDLGQIEMLLEAPEKHDSHFSKHKA